MAESSTVEVRLVRCPKCQNLLPEPKDCSFFRCGGCGTILCAKTKELEADSVSAKTMEDGVEETQVNSGSRAEPSDSDSSLRLQQTVGNNYSPSGLDRFIRRSAKRSDSNGFRSSASNYFTDSVSSDVAVSQDRAELVRILDKLKEQFLQPKEQQIPSSSPRFKKSSMRFQSSGTGPSDYYQYPNPAPPPYPYDNNPDVHLHGLMHGDPRRFQTHERTLQPSHPQYSRNQIGNNGDDSFDRHQRNGMLYQSSCSCSHCYDPYHRASGSVFPPSGLPDALHNVGFYPHDRNTGFRSSLHSPKTFLRPASRVHPSRAVSTSGRSRLVHPVAGGAPFIYCKHCSKLLKLPDKTDSSTGKQQSLRCGACSCLIDFSFADKKLILSTDLSSPRKAEAHSRVPWENALVDFSSDDCDNAAYEFHAINRGPDNVSSGQALICDKAQEMQTVDATSCVSEDELSSDSVSGRKLTPDLPLTKHSDYSSITVRDRSGPRSKSSRSEQDTVILTKRHNSIKEASVATERDDSVYSHNSEMSQDSADEYKENRGRTKKSGFTSIMKSSFKDLKKSIQNQGKSDVSVNGYPVTEHLVKMAEKQAGPIRPGNYWYDYRAGFWGIMGGQCLGILPPFIEELNYPMPENCAGGTTSVFVNGRELHQKDLRLLTARGLPRDKDRSYTVYISGRVIDEDTGEELDSLGKLAPTVDKLKRGFGMRVPRRAA